MPVEAYYRPSTVEEALDLSAEHEPSLEVISGGTLAMPAVNEGHKFPSHVMDLRELGLDYVESEDGHLTLGATLTLTQVLEQVDEPILQKAARHTGSWAVRNMGTVGGNLFAPPPLGDFSVALLALDAEVNIQGQNGQRLVPLSEFYTDSGEHAIGTDELITEIQLPPVEGETAYLKYTRSQEPAPPIVTVATNLNQRNGSIESARLAVNGAAPHPVRMSEAEDVLVDSSLDESVIEQAADLAAETANPPEDAIASEWYRRKMVREYVSRALNEIANEEDDK